MLQSSMLHEALPEKESIKPKMSGAARCFAEALRLDPDNPRVQANLERARTRQLPESVAR